MMMGAMTMKRLSNAYFINIVLTLLCLLIVAKTLSIMLFWYLPTHGVELTKNIIEKQTYQKVDFNNMLSKHSSSKKKKSSKNNSTNISNIILKGLYGNSNNGFVIVALKSSSSKTSVVSIGEVFSGYKLKNILNNRVIFTKENKEFILKIENFEKLKNLKNIKIINVSLLQNVVKKESFYETI